MASRYADRTLIILTWDEGGGYFDHVSPPGVSPVDMEAPGTRVAMLAIGRFARRNFVLHVPMEHSSLVKFLEWNYTGRTGQLMARDALVNNIGSMLDPAQTGVAVPER
jgi:phospholipase C